MQGSLYEGRLYELYRCINNSKRSIYRSVDRYQNRKKEIYLLINPEEMEDGVTEFKDLLVLDIPAGDQDGKEDIGCAREDNSSGGGGGGGMLSDLICALVSRDDIGEKEEEAEEAEEEGINNNNNSSSGGGGIINNLVSEILHQSGGGEHDEDDGNESQLGLIDTIISHLPSPLDDDAAPASDEACILIHSIVHD